MSYIEKSQEKSTTQDKNPLKYDFTFDMEVGDELKVFEGTSLHLLGFEYFGDKQVRLGIDAPSEVSILRLEVFAKHMQSYERIIDLEMGQKLRIGEETTLAMLPDRFNRKLLHFGIQCPENVQVKKSLTNNTVEGY